MAVTAAAGTLGFAPQNMKSTEIGYDPPTNWYRHKATQVDLAVLDDTRLGDDEVGGKPVPTFPYKAGVMVGGGMTLQPRLQDTLGWLLYGLMGNVETAPVAGASGAFDHRFIFNPDDASAVKWMSFRKYIPRKDGVPGTDLGEVFTDCKIVGSSFTLSSDRPLNLRMDVLGRKFDLVHDPSTWTWENEFEEYPTIPLGTHTSGRIQVAGQLLPIVQATVTFTNTPLDTRMERVFGSPYLEDITIVRRQLTYDLLVKWNNPALYTQILTGQPAGVEWAAQPFAGSFDVAMHSFERIGTTSEEHSLKITCPSAMLALNGGITLAGGEAVLMRFSGVALDVARQEYTTFTLRNGISEYTWPV